MQQSDYEIVGKFGFESRTHRLKKSSKNFLGDFFYISISSNIYQ